MGLQRFKSFKCEKKLTNGEKKLTRVEKKLAVSTDVPKIKTCPQAHFIHLW